MNFWCTDYGDPVRWIQSEFLALLSRCGEASTDDLRGLIALPDSVECNIWGAAIRGLSVTGQIVFVRFVGSALPSRRGGTTRIWRLPH